jgi:Zn-dependent peptidase ImmA (M78 family)
VSPDAWTWDLLLRLRTRFGVSAQILNIRLKELGLISRKKYNALDRKIKSHYEENGLEEPEENTDEISYRSGDLLSLNQRR